MKRRALICYVGQATLGGTNYGRMVVDMPWPMGADDAHDFEAQMGNQLRMKIVITSLAWLESPQDAGTE